MKAESLRLGNYVHFNKSHKELGIVTAISKEIGKDLDMVYLNQRIDNYFLMKHIKPIPLTEEWLLKLGFEKRSDYHKDNIRICLRFNSKHKIGIQSKKVFTLLTEIKYVHQLQNLYFALTNKELNNE